MVVNFLNLGKQPLANNFLEIDKVKDEFFYDLEVCFDEDTSLVSLTNNVQKELMFTEGYVYHSSGSKTMVNHFSDIATKIIKKEPKKILEIGSNDGAFIKNFKQEIAVAVEPCSNFAKITQDFGYDTYNKFWNTSLASEIESKHGKVDVIFAANCICHIPDLDETFRAVHYLLKDEGTFIFEDPSLLSMLFNTSYDQIYDEHAHIFSVYALKNILERNNLFINRVEKLKVHGGSNRLFVSKSPGCDNSVDDCISNELSLRINKLETYLVFANKVEESKNNLVKLLVELKNANHKIIGYGATSKSTTIYNYCRIGTNFLHYITDTTLDKQGKLSPGMHIPVVAPNKDGIDTKVDNVFLGAWNYTDEIVAKEKYFSGKFITHVPYVRII